MRIFSQVMVVSGLMLAGALLMAAIPAGKWWTVIPVLYMVRGSIQLIPFGWPSKRVKARKLLLKG